MHTVSEVGFVPWRVSIRMNGMLTMNCFVYMPLDFKVWKRAKEHVPGTVNDQRPSESGGGSTAPFDKQVIGDCWTMPARWNCEILPSYKPNPPQMHYL